MSDSIQRAGYLLAVMLIVANVMLFVGGYFEASEIPTVYRVLNCVDLDNISAEEYQEALLLRTQECELVSPVSDSFAVGVLDFLEAIPIVGSLITLFRIIFELVYVSAMGSVILMFKIGTPLQIAIPISIVYFLFMVITMYNIILRFTLARGGLK